MAINKNTCTLPLDDFRREQIRAALQKWFSKIGDHDSYEEVGTMPDETLVVWAKEEFGGDDCFHEDDDGNLI